MVNDILWDLVVFVFVTISIAASTNNLSKTPDLDLHTRPPVTPRLINLIPRNIPLSLGNINHQPLRPPPRVRRPVCHLRCARLHKADNGTLHRVFSLREGYRAAGSIVGVGEILRVEARRDGKLICSSRTC